jgi:hypothetical protein
MAPENQRFPPSLVILSPKPEMALAEFGRALALAPSDPG